MRELRFILPPSLEDGGVSIVDGALSSYRLDSIAWEQDGGNEEREPVAWSAGWQSDMSLFDFDSVDKNFPSGYKWSTKLDWGVEENWSLQDWTCLLSNLVTVHAMHLML